MRRSRSLTTDEKWELGIILFLFFAGFLCLTVIWRTQAVPRLWAFAFAPVHQTPTQQPLATPTETLEQLTQIPALPDSPAPFTEPAPATPTPVKKIVPKASTKTAVKKVDTTIRWVNGQKYRYLKTLTMRVTAYSPDSRCCWPYPGTTTASGHSVRTNSGRLVAADTRILPFHSLVSVPGYHSGELVPVLDRGGAIKGNRLDVLLPSYAQAKRWGSRAVNVKIYTPIDD